MKVIARVALYGTLIVAVSLLVIYTHDRPAADQYAPMVRVAANDAQDTRCARPDAPPICSQLPVMVSPRPSPTHEPFVAPTPFVHPFQSKSIAELQVLLRAHDPEAQCEMAIRLQDGKGVTKDEDAARLLYSVAAKQNNPCAVTNVGNEAYDQGDYVTASRYYHKAAALGYPSAMNDLGAVARYGPSHDETEAFKWYREAARHGFVPAYYLAGTGYITGRYGPIDKWLAFQWYQLGAQADDQDAKRDLAWFYTYQSDEPDRYQKAMAWLKKAPCMCSEYEIGRLYLKGLGVPADVHEAARYFKHAADQGYAPAQTAYANLLRTGRLGAPDVHAALTYYRGATEQGDGDAMDEIAQMTEQGVGVPRDPNAAQQMYVAAAAHCSGDALFRLAKISAVGSPQHAKDIDEAVALAGLSISCGEDSQIVGPFIKPLATDAKFNGTRSNEILQKMMSTIHDNTGNPNFELMNPLGPNPGGANTSI